MSAGEWLAHILAWAAYETWWRGHDTARPDHLCALKMAVMFCPLIETWDAIRVEHRRRVETLS